MTKRLLLLISVALFGTVMTANAQKPVRVIILPIKVHAPQELSYLQSEIPLAMEKNLQQENATIVKPDIVPESLSQGTAADVDEIKQFAQQHNGDFIIWGGLTWIDQQFSLDVKMLNPFGEDPPKAFYEEAAGRATDLSGERLLRYLADVERGHELMLERELEAYHRDAAWYVDQETQKMVHMGP